MPFASNQEKGAFCARRGAPTGTKSAPISVGRCFDMLKLTENPAMLHPDASAIESLGGRWWVGHTKARFEKQFAWDLSRRAVPYFLPMIERRTFSGGRRRKGLMPLFPSYVFFCGDDAARIAALGTDRLCQVIEVRDQQALKHELAALHRAITSGLSIDPYRFAVVGSRCRVRGGPLRGVEGTILRRDGIDRLVLEVRMLGRGALVEIDPELLEPLD